MIGPADKELACVYMHMHQGQNRMHKLGPILLPVRHYSMHVQIAGVA